MTTKLVAQAPMQRCACGTEYFVVHECDLKDQKPKPATDFVRKYKAMVEEVIRLRRQNREQAAKIAEQEEAITSLMLELADVRDIAQEQVEARDRRS